VADYFARRNLGAVTAWTDVLAVFPFLFDADEQLVRNEHKTATLEVSFDGENVHARMVGSTPSTVIMWENHVRRSCWVRRADGGAGDLWVTVMATTR